MSLAVLGSRRLVMGARPINKCVHTPTRSKSCGIIGLPNVGKSTLFNALTRTQNAEAANYPFCTIEPNTAIVSIPDPRLEKLGKLAKTKKFIMSQLEFTDIAGLVKGAHAGEGLGNQFLGNIRDVSVLIHVIRCYEDDDVIHVESSVDPVRDLEVIETELLLSDLQSMEKRGANLKKKIRAGAMGNESGKILGDVLDKIMALLDEGSFVASHKWSEEEEPFLDEFRLLTAKPMAYVCNVDEDSAATGNAFTESVGAYLKERANPHGEEYLALCASLEAEAVATFDTVEGRLEYLQLAGLEETSLDRVIRMSARMLDEHHFYTVGEKETRSWVIPLGVSAPQAAGKIHSDMQRGFIRAEVCSSEDFIEHEGEAGARAANAYRLEGKEYEVKDGDIMDFRFAV